MPDMDGHNFTYSFHGDPRATFTQFFGTSNPFDVFFGNSGGLGGGGGATFFDDQMDTEDPFNMFMGDSFGFSNFSGRPSKSKSFTNLSSPKRRKDPTVERDLFITLEEINTGCLKKMKISRKVIDSSGRTRTEDKILEVNVKPGWKAGTKITFEKEGDQIQGRVPADIVFYIRDKPHKMFTRDGADIKFTAKISLKQALQGLNIGVPTLSGEVQNLQLQEVVNPKTVHKLKGQGLPYPKDPTRRGDMVVTFDIDFPRRLSKSAALQIGHFLPD